MALNPRWIRATSIALALGTILAFFFVKQPNEEGSFHAPSIGASQIANMARDQSEALKANQHKAEEFEEKSPRLVVNSPTSLIYMGSLRGKIVDTHDIPLRNVAVTLYQNREFTPTRELTTRTTNEDGIFAFESLSCDASYWGMASIDGFAHGILSIDSIRPGKLTECETLTLQPESRISGTIVDAEQKPLPDVEVSCGHSKSRSDQDGRFQIGKLDGGSYRLQVHKEGFALPRGMDTTISVRDAEAVEGVKLQLFPTLEFEGQVLDELDRGIAMVGVLLVGGLTQQKFTDAQGRFSFTGLAPGNGYILVIYAGSNRPIHTMVAAGEKGRIFRIQSSQFCRLFLSDEQTNEDLAPSKVKWESIHPGSAELSAQNFLIQSDTSLQSTSLEGWPVYLPPQPGSYWLDVWVDGYIKNRSGPWHIVEGQQQISIKALLSRGAIIRGRVLDADSLLPVGEAITEATATSEDGTMTSVQSRVTIGEGRFEFDGFAKGHVQLTSYAPGFALTRTTVEVPTTHSALEELDILISRGGRILGRVYNYAEEPAQNFYVQFVNEDHLSFQKQTDSEGYFLSPPLPPGKYRALIYEPVRGLEWSADQLCQFLDRIDPNKDPHPLLVEKGKETQCELRQSKGPLGKIEGKIEAIGLPESTKLQVSLRQSKKDLKNWEALNQIEIPHKEGFEFGNLPPGDFDVQVSLNEPDRILATKQYDVSAGSIAQENINLQLGTILGRVFLKDSSVRDITVQLLPRQWPGEESIYDAEIDSEDGFVVSFLSPGNYLLFASATNEGNTRFYHEQPIDLLPGETRTVEILLQPCATLRILGAPGPEEFVHVAIHHQQGPETYFLQSQEDGKDRVFELSPGEYIVTATLQIPAEGAQKHETKPMSLRLEPGEKKTISLQR